MRFPWRRRETESLGLDEAEAYRRCHGTRGGKIRILPPEPVRPAAPIASYWSRPVNPRISGEDIRRWFLVRLETRRPAGAESGARAEVGGDDRHVHPAEDPGSVRDVNGGEADLRPRRAEKDAAMTGAVEPHLDGLVGRDVG